MGAALHGYALGDSLEHVAHDRQHRVSDEAARTFVHEIEHAQLGLVLARLDAERHGGLARVCEGVRRQCVAYEQHVVEPVEWPVGASEHHRHDPPQHGTGERPVGEAHTREVAVGRLGLSGIDSVTFDPSSVSASSESTG